MTEGRQNSNISHNPEHGIVTQLTDTHLYPNYYGHFKRKMNFPVVQITDVQIWYMY